MSRKQNDIFSAISVKMHQTVASIKHVKLTKSIERANRTRFFLVRIWLGTNSLLKMGSDSAQVRFDFFF